MRSYTSLEAEKSSLGARPSEVLWSAPREAQPGGKLCSRADFDNRPAIAGASWINSSFVRASTMKSAKSIRRVRLLASTGRCETRRASCGASLLALPFKEKSGAAMKGNSFVYGLCCVALAQAFAPAAFAQNDENTDLPRLTFNMAGGDYPLDSLVANEEGTAVVAVTIDEQAAFTEVELHESSGYPALD